MTKWILILLLSAISTLGYSNSLQDGAPRTVYFDKSKITNAIPKKEALSSTGNPVYYEVFGKRYFVLASSKGYAKRGTASWYGTKFHGRLTSSGEPYNMFAMTAANKTLPIPCYVRVTNLANGKKIIVKVNDRGPFHDDRIIDLSYAAAMKLDMLGKGTAHVEVEAIAPYQYHASKIKKSYAKNKQSLYLQLGAFGQQANAREFAKEVSNIVSEAVDIFKVQNNLGAMYRVKIGPLDDELHATVVNKQLQSAGVANGIMLYL